MTTLTLQPGLRPAQLPPTLQPHAVLNLAPPTAKGRSLAVATVVYAVLGGGLAWLARAGVVTVLPPPHSVGPVVLTDPAPPAVTPAMAHAPAVSKAPLVPVLAPPTTIPDTPALSPQEDLSNLPPAFTPQGPASPQTANTGTGTGTATDPIQLSGDAVRILHQVDPVYPPLAKAAHQQGQVVIRMTIDERGLPEDVRAISGLPSLQASALWAARQWRFQPATQDGHPVAATFLLTLNFVLR
jgi:protein TonB